MSRPPTDARASLLARLRSRAGEAAQAGPHPMIGALDSVPLVHSSMLEPADPVGSFVRNAAAAGATVHRIEHLASVGDLLGEIVARHAVRRAVASKQREAWPAVEALSALGVEVTPFDPTAAAAADLGVTVADAAIATTGSIVQRNDSTGGRSISLLPRVHLCLVPAGRVVPSSAEVFRPLGAGDLPSNLVVVTGPSKSGDIENTIVTGVHGPVALELVVVDDI